MSVIFLLLHNSLSKSSKKLVMNITYLTEPLFFCVSKNDKGHTERGHQGGFPSCVVALIGTMPVCPFSAIQPTEGGIGVLCFIAERGSCTELC